MIYSPIVAFFAFQVLGASAFSVTPKTSRPSFALRAASLPGGVDVGGIGASPEEHQPWDLNSVAAPSYPIRCEGGDTRKTFLFPDLNQDTVQTALVSEGRPMKAEIQVWIGPDWTPYTLKAFSEDGRQFPIQALVGTRGKEANLEIRNVGPYEMPFNAACSYAKPPLANIRSTIPEKEAASEITVQGGAIKTLALDPGMGQVRVLLKTDSRQLNARVELLNGPNNIKQQFEVFTNNGVLNSLYVVFDTPGSGNTIRIINQAPVEFPAYAFVSKV